MKYERPLAKQRAQDTEVHKMDTEVHKMAERVSGLSVSGL